MSSKKEPAPEMTREQNKQTHSSIDDFVFIATIALIIFMVFYVFIWGTR